MSDWQVTMVGGVFLITLGFAARFIGWDWIVVAGVVVMIGSCVWAAFYGKPVWENPDA